jgi:tight adherence protein C
MSSFVNGSKDQSDSITNTLQFFSRFSMSSNVLLNSKLKTKLYNAGLHGEKPLIIYYSVKTILSLIIPCASFLYSFYHDHSITYALSLAVGLSIVGYWICVASGLGLDAAITRVGSEIQLESSTLAQEFDQLGLELRAGTSRNQALANLATRTGLKDIEALVGMLKQANQFGTNVTEALQVFADDLRNKRRMHTQELAAKIPVKISIPIILCIFPALFVVILGPAIISLFNAFR